MKMINEIYQEMEIIALKVLKSCNDEIVQTIKLVGDFMIKCTIINRNSIVQCLHND